MDELRPLDLLGNFWDVFTSFDVFGLRPFWRPESGCGALLIAVKPCDVEFTTRFELLS